MPHLLASSSNFAHLIGALNSSLPHFVFKWVTTLCSCFMMHTQSTRKIFNSWLWLRFKKPWFPGQLPMLPAHPRHHMRVQPTWRFPTFWQCSSYSISFFTTNHPTSFLSYDPPSLFHPSTSISHTFHHPHPQSSWHLHRVWPSHMGCVHTIGQGERGDIEYLLDILRKLPLKCMKWENKVNIVIRYVSNIFKPLIPSKLQGGQHAWVQQAI